MMDEQTITTKKKWYQVAWASISSALTLYLLAFIAGFGFAAGVGVYLLVIMK